MRYKEYDYLKGIGIILVILGHSFSFTGFDLVDKDKYFIFYYIFKTIYSFHMPLFFMIAGFFTNKYYKIKNYYVSKIKRLLIPYIFINLLDSVPRHLFNNLVNNKTNSLKEVILYSGVTTWFIYTLFVISLLYPLLDRYILKKDKYFIFLVTLIVMNILNLIEIKIFTINRVIFYLMYFYSGYILKDKYDLLKKNKYFNSKLFSITLFLFFLFFSYTYSSDKIKEIFYPFVGIFLFLKLCLKIKENRLLEFCGKNSLTIYLLEPFFAVIYRVGLLKIISIENSYLLVSLFFLLKLISLILATLIINRIKIISFMFGNSEYKAERKMKNV